MSEPKDWVGKTLAEVQDLIDSRGGSTRIIRPGCMVTMDYRVDRLNVHIDSMGVITRIGFG